jgi:hypothetical protein
VNEQFRDSLAQDLRKSGFYSEMMAVHACLAAEWRCRGSFTYFDKDERTTRECDFEAVREWVDPGNSLRLQVTARLLGQVKKSEKPWIVFMDRQLEIADGLDNIIYTNARNRQLLAVALQQHSVFERNRWIGTGIHEAFKKPNDTSRWYSAFVSSCKAAESAFDTAIAAPRPPTYFELVQPLVVLDGTLVAAELAVDGQPLLSPIDEAAFAFEYRSDAYERPHYYLDVVTLEGLPRYLDSVSRRMKAVVETFSR